MNEETLVKAGHLDMGNGHYVPVYLKPAKDYTETLAKIDAIPLGSNEVAVSKKATASTGGRPQLDIPRGDVIRMRKNGMSNRTIAKQLGVSEGTIRRIKE